MSGRIWEFTDLEFKVVCDRYREGRMPPPLVFTTDIELSSEYDKARLETWQRLERRLTGDFNGVVEALRAPEVYLRVHGWDERDMEDPKRRIRMHAMRRATRAYVINQKPGRTQWHSGGYTVAECDPRALAEAVVGVLPEVKPGRSAEIELITDHGGIPRSGSWIKDDLEDSVEARSRSFLRTRAERTGTITVTQGHSKFGPRGIAQTRRKWRDISGDGRYVIAGDARPVACGTSAAQLTRMLDVDIEQMMRRLETHWEPVDW
ncbi:ESX secretion-associated protein EspG [Nocardia mexicana]|uniref:ESAT-6 protein secretion system EspG family protein n=1 Tax=Nocardia mexicana TaxID=279262 RepID=A0A370GIZ1_9NOCA|nr:ESX secretion-associated protein EspG [Nocardia mexicana]RDI43607.1 ESAT-6 protein secretion system EspG family protein [Nocardia mexicana]